MKSFDNKNVRFIFALNYASAYFTWTVITSFHNAALRKFKSAFRLSNLRITRLPAAEQLLPKVVALCIAMDCSWFITAHFL